MALSADTPRTYASGVQPIFISLPCTSNVTIYEGSAVGEATTAGTVQALATGQTIFWGFAHEQVINPSSGTKRCKIRAQGIIRIAVTGASAVTDNGVSVYGTDDGTFTLTATTTMPKIGRVVRWVGTDNGGSGSTVCDVFFQANVLRVAEVSA
jgi:hypothetical protein